MVTGFAAGYYLGAKAGRQRYDQINRALRRARRSDAFESAATRARTVLDGGVERARGLVDGSKPALEGVEVGNGHGPGLGLRSTEIDDLGAEP